MAPKKRKAIVLEIEESSKEAQSSEPEEEKEEESNLEEHSDEEENAEEEDQEEEENNDDSNEGEDEDSGSESDDSDASEDLKSKKGRGRGRGRGGVSQRGRGSLRGTNRPLRSGKTVTPPPPASTGRGRGRSRGRGRGRGRGRLQLASKYDSPSESSSSSSSDESVDNWGTTSDEEMEDDIIPSEIDVKRAGNSSDISVPASSLGKLAGAYAILRAFSWQIRLSPFLFEELCAAFCSPKSSPLLDEIFLCILRTFAQDENKDHRATRLLDLNNLDYITWFEYVWEWLRLTENPLSAKYSSFSHSKKEISSPQDDVNQANETLPAEIDVNGISVQDLSPKQDTTKKGSEKKSESTKKTSASKPDQISLEKLGLGEIFGPAPTENHRLEKVLKKERTQKRHKECEFHLLPVDLKASIIESLCNDLLATNPVRQEIVRREESGQLISGKGGEGGAYPMRTLEERKRRAEAMAKDDDENADGNLDVCVLCAGGGNLLCCDGCPAAYHLKCLGESGKHLPEGDWLCSECALGGRGESAGLRAALAGENAQKQKHYLLHGALYRFQGGKREGRGKRAREEGNESADRHIGQEALDKLEGLKYEEDYEDDGYVLSSADALRDPLPTGGSLTSADTYVNKYKQGWIVSSQIAQQYYNDSTKRKGRGKDNVPPPIPLSELAIPVPISRFLWQQAQGRASSKQTEKCNRCNHCLKPQLRKACLNPQPKYEEDSISSAASKLTGLINYILRTEREWWSLMENSWASTDYAKLRNDWTTKVREAQSVSELSNLLLEMEEAMRPNITKSDWDPNKHKPKPPPPLPQIEMNRVQTTTRGLTKLPTRWQDPDNAKARRAKKLKRKFEGLEDEDEENEAEKVEDELVDDLMTQKTTYWSHCHRGKWARWHGRHSLPKNLLKKQARSGACARIPGVKYSFKEPTVFPRLKWQAACELSQSSAELALQLREFDGQILWDSSKLPPSTDPTSNASISAKRKSEGNYGYEYLVLVPNVFQRGQQRGAKNIQSIQSSVPQLSRFAPSVHFTPNPYPQPHHFTPQFQPQFRGLIANYPHLSQTLPNQQTLANPAQNTSSSTRLPSLANLGNQPFQTFMPLTQPRNLGSGLENKETLSFITPKFPQFPQTQDSLLDVVKSAQNLNQSNQNSGPNSAFPLTNIFRPNSEKSKSPSPNIQPTSIGPNQGISPIPHNEQRDSRPMKISEASQNGLNGGDDRNQNNAKSDQNLNLAEEKLKTIGSTDLTNSKLDQNNVSQISRPIEDLKEVEESNIAEIDQTLGDSDPGIPEESSLLEENFKEKEPERLSPVAQNSQERGMQDNLSEKPAQAQNTENLGSLEQQNLVNQEHKAANNKETEKNSEEDAHVQPQIVSQSKNKAETEENKAEAHKPEGGSNTQSLNKNSNKESTPVPEKSGQDLGDSQALSEKKREMSIAGKSIMSTEVSESRDEFPSEKPSRAQSLTSNKKGNLRSVEPDDLGSAPSVRAKLRRLKNEEAAKNSATPVLKTTIKSTKIQPVAPKPATPEQYMMSIIGKEAQWVHESMIPIWLLRSYEEKVKREIALAQSLATRQAAQAQAAQDLIRNKEAEAEAARKKACSQAESCAECNRSFGDDTEKDEIWIACDSCLRWYHGQCANVTTEMLDIVEDENHWECHSCWFERTEERRHAIEKIRKKEERAARAALIQQELKDAENEKARLKLERKLERERKRNEARALRQEGKTGVDEPEELYCVCQKPYDGTFMIECESCQQWFHPACQDMTIEEVEEMEEFRCLECSKKKGKIASKVENDESLFENGLLNGSQTLSHPRLREVREGRQRSSKRGRSIQSAQGKAEKALNDNADSSSWLKVAELAISKALEDPVTKPFSVKITNRMAPEYNQVVLRPMDLSLILKNITSGTYTSLYEIEADVNQVWANCRLYNPEGDSILEECARAENLVNNLWTEEGLGDMLNPKPDIESKEARKKTKDGAGKSSGLQKHEDIKMIAKSGTSSQRRLGRWEQPITEEQESLALNTVRVVALDRNGTPFAYPVSEEDAPGYRDYIKEPMDFETIQNRLKDHYYPSTDAILEDVGLVWSNCREFNTIQDSFILKACAKAEEKFENLWKKAGLPEFMSGRAIQIQEQSKKSKQKTKKSGEDITSKPNSDIDQKEEGLHVENARPKRLKVIPPSNSLLWSEDLDKSRTRQKRKRNISDIEEIEDLPAEETSSERSKKAKTLKIRLNGMNALASKDSGDERPKKRGKKGDLKEDPDLIRVKQGILEPERSISQSQSRSSSSKEFSVALKILRGVAKTKAGSIFANPVSIEAVPDYLSIIRKPMDFGQIIQNIQNSSYTSLDEVLRDVNLIWANCHAYNNSEDPIMEECKNAEGNFQERWLLAGLAAENLLEKPSEEEILVPQKQKKRGKLLENSDKEASGSLKVKIHLPAEAKSQDRKTKKKPETLKREEKEPEKLSLKLNSGQTRKSRSTKKSANAEEAQKELSEKPSGHSEVPGKRGKKRGRGELEVEEAENNAENDRASKKRAKTESIQIKADKANLSADKKLKIAQKEQPSRIPGRKTRHTKEEPEILAEANDDIEGKNEEDPVEKKRGRGRPKKDDASPDKKQGENEKSVLLENAPPEAKRVTRGQKQGESQTVNTRETRSTPGSKKGKKESPRSPQLEKKRKRAI